MTQPAAAPPEDARYAALGRLVEMAAVMEIALRMAFCALIGSRYAAVVAGGQETHWLIENCEAITRHRGDLAEAQRETIRAALRSCRDANRDRNRLVHDAWGTDSDGAPGRTAQRARAATRSPGAPGRLPRSRQLPTLSPAPSASLLAAIEGALGPGSMRSAEQLLAADSTERGR